MKRHWAIVMALGLVTSAWMAEQQPTTTEEIAKAIEAAVKSADVVPAGPGDVRLNKVVTVPTDAAATGAKSRSVIVEYQLGSVGDKRLFANVAVPVSDIDTIDQALGAFLESSRNQKTLTLADGAALAGCTGTKECVRVCPKPGGGEFCCKWQCRGDR